MNKSLVIPSLGGNTKVYNQASLEFRFDPAYWTSHDYKQRLIEIVEAFPEGTRASIMVDGTANIVEGIIGPIKERTEENRPPVVLFQDPTFDWATDNSYNSTIPTRLFTHGGVITALSSTL